MARPAAAAGTIQPKPDAVVKLVGTTPLPCGYRLVRMIVTLDFGSDRRGMIPFGQGELAKVVAGVLVYQGNAELTIHDR